MSIRHELGEHISSASFQSVDGELRAVGKFGQISFNDDAYELWIIKPNLQPLSELKLTHILKKIPANLGFTRLNGEAFLMVRNKELVLQMLPLLGIRKRRAISDDVRKCLIKRMEDARNERGKNNPSH